ncbi:MAG: hypothetical protein H6739_35240 [Alphaproteobacteria bacterium]|nr:hypothetical protein [Alphaproteobacteria bacterium]
MDTWTTIKTAFGSKSSNRKRYQELRPQAADPIADVELILLARGKGLLREDVLGDIEEEWTDLHGKLQAIDTKSEKDPGTAFKRLFKLVEPARTLLSRAQTDRQRAEQREQQRLEDKEHFEEMLQNAKFQIEHIVVCGADRPEPIATHLDDAEDLLNQLAESDQFLEAIGVLNGIIASLEELDWVMAQYVGAKRREPDDLTQSQQQDVTTWVNALLAAVKASKLDEAKAALGKYKAFVYGFERNQEVQRELNRLDPRDVYPRYHLKIEDILKYPKKYRSPQVAAHQMAVGKARAQYQGKIKLLETAEAAQKRAASGTGLDQLSAMLEAWDALEAASEALENLKTKLTEAGKPIADHDAAMRRYYAALKKLTPRITLARALPEQESGVDTPWKAERVAFDTALQAVRTEVNPPKRDFAQGLTLLTTLETRIDALSTARTTALNADINTATDGTHGSANKSKDLVLQLARTPGLIREMSPQQQLKLLKSLRTQLCFCKDCDQGFEVNAFANNGDRCPNKEADGVTDCNSINVDIPAYCEDDDCMEPWDFSGGGTCASCGAGDWQYEPKLAFRFKYKDSTGTNVTKNSLTRNLLIARAFMFKEMKLTDEFEQHDQQKRKETTTALRNDPMFEEARDNWSDWVRNNNTARIEAFFNQAIKIQCRILGHNQKGLSRTKNGVTTQFPDVPVKVRLDTPNPPKPNLFGYCEAGFPTFIAINTTSDKFGDFKEQVDTIVHENAHAFQAMLVKKLKAEDPFTDTDKQELLNDPDLGVQAQLFLENEETYIDRDDFKGSSAARKLSSDAYRHEPFEEHSWTTGGTISKSLLVPPQIESFESSRAMKSKIWLVKAVTREARCTVTLNERHGIYGDEWEGEEASDKKLILENIKKGGSLRSAKVRIIEVIDEFRLQLNLDTSTYDPLVKLTFDETDPKRPVLNQGTDNDKVAGESIRLILNERVKDL